MSDNIKKIMIGSGRAPEHFELNGAISRNHGRSYTPVNQNNAHLPIWNLDLAPATSQYSPVFLTAAAGDANRLAPTPLHSLRPASLPPGSARSTWNPSFSAAAPPLPLGWSSRPYLPTAAPSSEGTRLLIGSPAREHFELDGAISRNQRTNPQRSGNSYAVDIDELYFKTMLDQLRGAVPAGYGESTQPPTIYKVPEELKITNLWCDPRGEHKPIAVCLGRTIYDYFLPPGTQRLQKYKWSCARQLISRHSRLLEPARTPVLLHECFTSMKRIVPRVRASYSVESETSLTAGARPDNEVAEIVLKDGCFILHRLLKYARRAKMETDGGSGQFDDDDEDWTQVYGRCFMWQFVTRDMLLLENQIPFFVIRELFQQLRNDDESEELLVTGSLRLFRSLRPQMLHCSPIACDDVHHLLHLFYLSVGLPPTDRQQHQDSRCRQSDELLSEIPQWIPCAKELEEAGVRFRTRRNATSFLDIKFAHGVMEIPQLELNDSSESLFRNLIAFEQTYPDTARDVSTYGVFMNCLVTSEEDMRILDLHGILVNHLNSRRDVAWRFFSDIVAQVHWSTDNYLVGLMNAVNRYRDSRRHKWRAALVRNYFSNPWVTMSVLAALLLLVMSVLQTFFTVYAYFKPPK